jgi:hypothetical protein
MDSVKGSGRVCGTILLVGLQRLQKKIIPRNLHFRKELFK